MARTQARDYDKKRDVITSHAAKLFARRGFAGASISDLAAACGVSKSLIYHYYDAKEFILFDVMRDHIDELLKIVSAADKSSPDAKQEFRDMTRRLMRCYAGAQHKQKVLLYELSYLSKTQRAEIVSKQRKIIAQFESLLAHAAPNARHDRALLRTQTMLFFGMINWTHTWFKPSGHMSRDALSDLAANTILGALD